MSLLGSELCPFSSLGDFGVDVFLLDCGADLAGGLDFLAVVV